MTIVRDLEALVAKLKLVRGDSETWLKRQLALNKYIATLPSHQRVFSRGEVHYPDHHYPAILIYDTNVHLTLALVAKYDEDEIVEDDPSHFYSTVPYAATAREVYNELDSSIGTI